MPNPKPPSPDAVAAAEVNSDPAWTWWLRRARLGAHTHAFRHLGKPEAVLDAVREAGFGRVELWTGHLAPAGTPEAEAWAQALRAAGIAVDAAGIHLFTGGPEDRLLLEAARAAGAGVVTADLSLPRFPAVLAEVDAMARDLGLRVALHNHGAPHWLGNRAMLAHALGRCSEAVGLCLDVFWFLDSREDVRRILRELGPRVHSVHLHDGISLPDRTMIPRHLGEGEADLHAVVSWLRDQAFEGPVVFEAKDAPERMLPLALERFRRGPAAFQRDNLSIVLPPR